MGRALNIEDIEFEIGFYENIVKNSPDFVEALTALGDLYTRKGLYLKGLRIDQKLASLRPEDPVILYNLACSYSLLKDLNKAFLVMKQAIALGYDDLDYLEQDRDLENLRQSEKFAKYILSLKNSIADKTKK
ncbi:MAG: hypothetical protein HQL27_06740 [Candidatus Omnitrophica bacterium]|nr:hypothetical protein [Candidatus Omnitrophota bacterium]